MSDQSAAKPHSRPTVQPIGREVQGYLFLLEEDTDPLPGLDAFFPEPPTIPVAEVPDLDFERSRRRFTQGA